MWYSSDKFSYTSGMLGSTKIIIVDAKPVYVREVRFKKHRKKKNKTARVKRFSHFWEAVGSGEAIHDKTNNAMYMNRATYANLLQAMK